MKTLITAMSLLLLAACGTTTPYKCTSMDPEICNLQHRMVRIEDKIGYDRAKTPPVMTDKELIDEMKRRRLVRTYAAPDQ